MTMAALPVVMAIGSAAFTAYSGYQQSAATKNAYEYQSKVSANNSKIAEWNAQDAARRGEQTLIDTQRRTAALMGTQRATLAGRGIDLSEGSALNILSDTAYLGEQDALTVKNNTAKEVWKSKVAANDASANSELLQSRSDSENPLFSGATSLLTGAGKVADSWYKYRAA